MNTERDAWIFLNRIPDLGPIRFHRLLALARSAEGILELPVSGLLGAEVSQDVAECWHRDFRDSRLRNEQELELKLESQGTFRIITELDEDYPSTLRDLLDRPPVLYYKGRWPIPETTVVALVGTRHPSPYGISVARSLTNDLAAQGVVTVSGLAKGIDAEVHRVTLTAGGHTVAVLGCGVGQVYPKENTDLQREIEEKGTLITEFPYNSQPDSAHFPRRNRIISGLSKGVVVIEARQRSGALITARYAAEQGRDVFAVPGSIFQGTSGGCHRLIKEGAKLVEQAGDILEELGITQKIEATPPLDLSAQESGIYDLLSQDPLSVDEIAQRSTQRFDQIASCLLELELKGLIRNLPGQRYVRN